LHLLANDAWPYAPNKEHRWPGSLIMVTQDLAGRALPRSSETVGSVFMCQPAKDSRLQYANFVQMSHGRFRSVSPLKFSAAVQQMSLPLSFQAAAVFRAARRDR
jgi:hypothetical protein